MATHDPKRVPDPSKDCPRCHYFEQKAEAEDAQAAQRVLRDSWPLGIDQKAAQELLAKAFPQKQRTYG